MIFDPRLIKWTPEQQARFARQEALDDKWLKDPQSLTPEEREESPWASMMDMIHKQLEEKKAQIKEKP